MPDFGCIDPMPIRALTARQEKIDRRRRGALPPAPGTVVEGLIPERLTEMAAFGMGFKVEQFDDLGGSH